MIQILKTGIQTSFQDFGRIGYRNLGVPISGCMDRQSALHGNLLVGNKPDTAVIEFSLVGPSIQFLCAAKIALTGGKFEVSINGDKVSFDKPISVLKGNILTIGASTQGNFGYLAVAGGFETERVLGSCSQYKGITTTDRLEKNQIVQIQPGQQELDISLNSSIRKSISYFTNSPITVDPGPEFRLFSKADQHKLVSNLYTLLPTSNRMAFVTAPSTVKGKGIVTSPVMPGTVQLTPAGQLLILMRDAQTTGGYSRVFQLTSNSIDLLAQRRFRDHIKFKLQANTTPFL